MSTNAYDVGDVLAQADQNVQAVDGPSRLYVEHIRAQFAHAVAMLDVHPMPAEIREAVEIAISMAFEIGGVGKNTNGAWRFAHDTRTYGASQKKAESMSRQVEMVRALLVDMGLSLDKPVRQRTIDKLAKKMKKSTRQIERYVDLL